MLGNRGQYDLTKYFAAELEIPDLSLLVHWLIIGKLDWIFLFCYDNNNKLVLFGYLSAFIWFRLSTIHFWFCTGVWEWFQTAKVENDQCLRYLLWFCFYNEKILSLCFFIYLLLIKPFKKIQLIQKNSISMGWLRLDCMSLHNCTQSELFSRHWHQAYKLVSIGKRWSLRVVLPKPKC